MEKGKSPVLLLKYPFLLGLLQLMRTSKIFLSSFLFFFLSAVSLGFFYFLCLKKSWPNNVHSKILQTCEFTLKSTKEALYKRWGSLSRYYNKGPSELSAEKWGIHWQAMEYPHKIIIVVAITIWLRTSKVKESAEIWKMSICEQHKYWDGCSF